MKVEARTFIILVCSTVYLNAEKSQILDFSINVHHFLRNTQYLAPRHKKTNFCQQQNQNLLIFLRYGSLAQSSATNA